MDTRTLTGDAFLRMLRNGASHLKANRKAVNDLNVFPIPDGDTGDNMYMTINSGCDSAAGAAEPGSVGSVSGAASSGMLLGARGNSGVILSRIFAGLAKGLDGHGTVNTATFAAAMRLAVEEAYGAVSTPVEGTILTVLKDSVATASKSGADTLEKYFAALIPEMEASLERTPELLAVLKDAGVVDSGGAGLLCIAKGMAAALDGETADEPSEEHAASAHKAVNLDAFTPDSVLEFGYCTEFLLRLQTCKVDLATFDESVIRDYLNAAGDSVVCFREGSIVKVHVHTKRPGDILNHCQQWGEYLTIKCENMTLQHEEIILSGSAAPTGASDIKAHRSRLAVVTVASGDGLVAALREAGADEVIEGGQTMNPSAESFIKAFDSVNAETVIVFPNNSNVILTAQQAAGLYGKSRVEVVPTKNFGEGYVAIASMDRDAKDIDALLKAAEQNAAAVTTGMVSKAIRDASKDSVEVHEGDFIGFMGGKILTDAAERPAAAEALCDAIDAGSHDVVLVFYGAEVPEEEAEALSRTLGRKFRMTEFMTNAGGQLVYDYIFVLC